MLTFLLIVAFLIGIWRTNTKTDKKEYWLSQYCTTCINGIFVMLIILSHFFQYVSENISCIDSIYLIIMKIIGQTVVSTFFFFSGYGIMINLQRDKKGYTTRILKYRIPKVLINFDLALFLFLFVQSLLRVPDTPLNILLAFTGWSKLAISNSNWFIFTTLCMYIIIYISFRISKKSDVLALCFVFLLTCLYVYLIVHSENNASRFYNTVFCFIAGMIFCKLKTVFYDFMNKKNINYIFLLVLDIICCIAFYLLYSNGQGILNNILYNLYAISFAMLFVIISFKFHIGNKILYWLGLHTFSIYILQRIPYIVFEKMKIKQVSLVLYFALSLISTIIIAYLFDKLLILVDKAIFKKNIKLSK